eukprot:2452930-Prymnesium_polylepis.1
MWAAGTEMWHDLGMIAGDSRRARIQGRLCRAFARWGDDSACTPGEAAVAESEFVVHTCNYGFTLRGTRRAAGVQLLNSKAV